MHPEDNTFGCGPSTPLKLRRFAGLLPWILRMSARHVAASGGTFWFFDANAGPGLYHGLNGERLRGSPILALETLRALPVPARVHLIERDEAVACRLRATLRETGTECYELHVGDNRAILPNLCTRPDRRRDRGVILFDPRGSLDWGLIDRLMSLDSMAHIDVLVNVATATLKLERLAAQSPRYRDTAGWREKDVRPLRFRLDVLHKRRLLISEPTRDRLAWSLVLGSNWPRFPEWRAGQFDAVGSPTGKARLERVSYTERERKELAGGRLI